MREKGNTMGDRVIGLDIGASSMKAAQVERRDDGTFIVEKVAARALPEGLVFDGRLDAPGQARVSEILRELVETEGFEATDVIYGLASSSASFMRQVLVPAAGLRPEDVDKALPLIITQFNSDLSPRDNELSYSIVGTLETDEGTQLQVLVYSALREYSEELARVVQGAGLNVAGADLSALAALRASSIAKRAPNQVDVILDIGAEKAAVFVHHNGVPQWLLLEPGLSGREATKDIGEEMGLPVEKFHQAEYEKVTNAEPHGPVARARERYSSSVAESLNSALRSFINTTAQFDSIGSMTLIGGGVRLHGLSFFIQQALGTVPLNMAQYASEYVDGQGAAPVMEVAKLGGDYLVAVGLASGEKF